MSASLHAALASWAFHPWIFLSLLVTGWIYWRGWRALQFTRPTQFPVWRLACFFAGLATLWIAIASPLDSLGGMLLFAHMAQHLILMSVAPPLILMGAPVVPVLRGLPRWFVRDTLGPFFGIRRLHQAGRFLTRPIVCWLAMNVAYIGWHLVPAYELALRSSTWHEVEHACFFLTCILFWWPVLLPWPTVARGSRWIMLPYLVSADLVNTALSAFFCFAGRVLYPTYVQAPRLFGLSALQDQIAAGALMWVIGSTIFLLPAVVITVQLLSPRLHRHDKKHLTRKSTQQQAHQQFDLLKMPFIGWLLRARYGRMSLQLIALIIAIAVIVHGLFGHPMGSMNLAGIIPWIYARALGVIALIAVGNLFCMACPFTLPRELGRKLGLATHSWPKYLRNKWLSAALLLLFFWAFEVFAFWDSPARTAWLVVAYFVTAFVVDSLFRGASFCKYVCPIGQFNFVGSLLSPLELKSANRSVCEGCKTHDCIAGNEKQRGCELQLFIPQKVGNMDCTLCMDCVKACPHDNIVIFAGAPGRDLIIDPVRSSIGKFSSRIDIAAVVIIVVTAAFASAAVMVQPITSWIDRLATRFSTNTGFALSLMLALLLPAVLFGVVSTAALITRSTSRTTDPIRNIICRSSLTLLPLALSMWCAHLSFHLLTGWNTLAPAIRQAASDLHLSGFAPPDWNTSVSSFTPDGLLTLQMLLLDAGLLLSLYIAWRILQQGSGGGSRTILSMVPWATVSIGLYSLGVWILLQPMQMRNMVHG